VYRRPGTNSIIDITISFAWMSDANRRHAVAEGQIEDAMPMLNIVTTADRPDLVPIAATWLWKEWGQYGGCTIEQTCDAVAAAVSTSGPPQVFVLLVDDKPVGTSSLVVADMDERPQLTPWMANVFVAPEARRKGYVIPLVRAVEAACRSAAIPTLWLHTDNAERIYTRAGWCTVEIVHRPGKAPATLMRRDLELDV
jgi:Acetyltransferase (GNAT) family